MMLPDAAASPAAETAPDLSSIAVVIPVWKPPMALPDLVQDLLTRGFGRVVVVDDGSGDDYRPVFDRLRQMQRVDVVVHPGNFGKGRALKSGLLHLEQAHPEPIGAVTADADGQHLPEDIQRVGLRLLVSGERCVLGTRTFDRAAPFVNRMGNRITALVFRALTNCPVSDTQTGLRGLPRGRWERLLALPGDRYEYETATLVHLCRSGQPPIEVPIKTVYLDGNRSTHFRLLRDSFHVYKALFQSTFRR